jgi:hypothetical protein
MTLMLHMSPPIPTSIRPDSHHSFYRETHASTISFSVQFYTEIVRKKLTATSSEVRCRWRPRWWWSVAVITCPVLRNKARISKILLRLTPVQADMCSIFTNGAMRTIVHLRSSTTSLPRGMMVDWDTAFESDQSEYTNKMPKWKLGTLKTWHRKVYSVTLRLWRVRLECKHGFVVYMVTHINSYTQR